EVHSVDAGRRQRLRAQVVLAQGGVERLIEERVRLQLPIRQRYLQLLGHHLEGDRIGSWRREGEIDQLKHCLEILARRATGQSFFSGADVGVDVRRGTGKNLVQIAATEITETAL